MFSFSAIANSKLQTVA